MTKWDEAFIKQIAENLAKELGRDPTPKEIDTAIDVRLTQYFDQSAKKDKSSIWYQGKR
tara:strand:+ start:303 stop:479 length:177 start_codon:yes stop_codon:yes gene_type:complete